MEARVVLGQSCYLRNAASVLRLYNYHCSIKSDKAFEAMLFQVFADFATDAIVILVHSLHDNTS